MAEQNLIKQIEYTLKLFLRIIVFALFGLIFTYACNIDPISGYRIIIIFALIGSVISVFDVIKNGMVDKND